ERRGPRQPERGTALTGDALDEGLLPEALRLPLRNEVRDRVDAWSDVPVRRRQVLAGDDLVGEGGADARGLEARAVLRERLVAREVLGHRVREFPGRDVVVDVDDGVDRSLPHERLRARIRVKGDHERLVRELLAAVTAGHDLTGRLPGRVERHPD